MTLNSKVAIMQPYIFPYIGYWQLINYVDTFVVYDEIEYTKKGWINRNRILRNGEAAAFSLPIKKDSDTLFVNQRFLSGQSDKDKQRLLRQIQGAYQKAPFFNEGMKMVTECFADAETNLFGFVYSSILYIKGVLDIQTDIIPSSSLHFDNTLKSEDKIISICSALGASQYINPIGGTALYDKAHFKAAALELKFQKVHDITYPQFEHGFIASLSIIDVIMFNGITGTKQLLNKMNIL